jgi:hypothetical protein
MAMDKTLRTSTLGLPVARALRTPAVTMLVAVMAIAALTASPARADHLGTALGSAGQIYTVTAGAYGTLFPGSHTYSAETPVLALDTTLPGAAPTRQVVPSSADGDVELSPALIYEDSSKTLFVVWVSSNAASSFIELTSYDGSRWSPAITILSNVYAPKTPPQLAMTRDTHQEVDPVSGSQVTRHRTVLHIVWSEDSTSGKYQAYYTPVIFEEGAWIGTVPTAIHLNAFDAPDQAGHAGPGTGAGPFNSPLVFAPTVQGGRDTSTAIAGFASNVSGMLTATEIDVLPEELRILADACSATILANGAQYFPNQLGTLATQVQNVVMSDSGAFQAEALQAIASAAQSSITAGASDVTTMAGRTRATIVEIGARFARRGLRIDPGAPGVALPQIVEILVPGAPSHFLQFRVTASRPSPAVGTNALQLFLSRTGQDALAAWTNAAGSSVFYTGTQPDGSWSGVNQLQISSTMSLQQAYQVLEQRMQY